MSTVKKTSTKVNKAPQEEFHARDFDYRLLAEHSFDLVIVQSINRNIVYVNQSWVDTLGYTVEESVGRPATDFVAPEFHDRGKERNQKRRSGDDDLFKYELEFIAQDGERIPVEIQSSPVRTTADGEIAEVLIIARDLSEKIKNQVALLESEGRYRDLFESAPMSIWEEDFSGVKAYLDQRKKDGIQNFEQYFDQNPEELIECIKRVKITNINQRAVELHRAESKRSLLSTNLYRIFTDDSVNTFKKVLLAFINGETVFQGEGLVKRLDGTEFYQSVYCRLLEKNQSNWEQVIIATEEITEIKKTQEKLTEQLNELNVLQATAFTCAQAKDIDSLIRQITNIIGNTLYADIYGVILVDEERQLLTPHSTYSFQTQEQERGSCPLSCGITGKAIRTQKTIRVDDVQNDDAYFESSPSIKSELAVPIKVIDKVFGVLNVESAKPAKFTKADERLLGTIASQMSTAIQKLKLLETEKQRRTVAETLQKIAAALTTTLDQKKAIDLILNELYSVIEFSSASIQLLKNDQLVIVGGIGELVQEIEKDRTFPYPGDNPNTVVLDTGRPYIIEDAQNSYLGFKEMPGIKSWLGVPLVTKEHPIGLLTLDSDKPSHFTVEDAELVTSFAHHAAISLENARLFEAEQKRLREAETLRETALAVTSSLNIDDAIQQILEQLSRVLPYDSAGVQIVKDGYAINLGGRGWKDPEAVMKIHFPIPGDNPNTEVILQKKVVILQNAQLEHAPFRENPHNSIHSWMGIPMIIRDKAIGMLAVDSEEKNHFDQSSAEIAQTFAMQAAIAIENARLFEEERKQLREAETLRQAAHTISSSLDLREVLDTILASLQRVIPFHSAAVMLREKNKIEITSAYNLPGGEQHIGETFPSNDGLFSEILERKHPVILNDAQKSSEFGKWAETDYVRGWMGVPLIARGEVIGYITLDSLEPNAYQKRHAELSQVFAHQAASAISNARLYQEALQTAERRSVLHRISQDISRGIQSPETIYKAVHQAAEKLMVCDAFVISLRNESDPEHDQAVYLIDMQERFPARLTTREASIITLTEQTGGSLISGDIATDKLIAGRRENRFGKEQRVRSMLVSPMRIGNKLIGALSAQSYKPNIYGTEETVLLEMLASHAAAALENARLLEEARQRGREFAELYQVSQDLVTNQDTGKVLKAMLERATRLIGVSVADIYTYDEKSNELIATNVYGLNETDSQKLLGVRLKMGEGMAGKVAQDLQPMRVNDYRAWKERSQQYDDLFPFTAVMELPLVYGGNLLGVLALFEVAPNSHQFTDDEERIMSLFAAQLSSAMHSAKQLEQITTRLAELEAINHLSMALRTTKTPDEMLPILLDEISRSLHVDVSVVWLVDPHSDHIYKAIERGWIKNIPPNYQKTTEGIIGRVFTDEKAYRAKNIAEDPYIKTGRTDLIPDNWTGLWVPIRASHAITGVIGVMAEAPREFDESDLQILNIMAEMAGNAFHRARLHRRTEQQLKRLTALHNIDLSISAHAELHVTLQLLIEQTIKQLDVDAANILLTEKTTKSLKYFVGNGFKNLPVGLPPLHAGEGLPGKAIQQRKVLHTNDIKTESSPTRRLWLAEEDFQCYYCIPLNAKGNILGVLEIFKRTHINTPSEWMDFFESLASQAAIAIDNHVLVEDLRQSNEDLARAYDTTLEGWGKALELRDKETQGHTLNVTDLTLKLARHIGIPDSDMLHIYRGALLHDIGKMGIPDNILHKPGPLTKDEWTIMRQHPQFAYNMLSSIPYLRPAIDIPYCHHERWDGTGYPRGLKGEDIPLAARIFSIVDVWDALLADRPYRDAWPQQVVINYIRNESGTRFDPDIVEIFLEMVEREID